MASTAVQLVIDDPENFHLLTTDMKEKIIEGAINTVNMQAAMTRKNAIKNIQGDFTLRNNFTTTQVQFEQMQKTRFISLSQIVSRVGITERAGYMARQETGGKHIAANGTKLAIPTTLARGGNRGSAVLKKNYLSKIKRMQSGMFSSLSGSSRFIARAEFASKNNLAMYHKDKLFKISDFTKSGGRITFKMDMIYNMERQETTTEANPWLRPAAENPARDAEKIFISQMKKLGM